MLGCLVLYFIPIRYLLMLWGTNKFLRRIFRPHAVPNNELLDLLSRVPDDEMLVSTKSFACTPSGGVRVVVGDGFGQLTNTPLINTNENPN